MARGSILVLALSLAACPSSGVDSPDASPEADATLAPDAEPMLDGGAPDDAAAPDAAPLIDGGFFLKAASLTPAAGTSSAAGFRLQGTLRVTAPGVGTTSTHKLRGGLTPQGY